MKRNCYSRRGVHAQQMTLTSTVYLNRFGKLDVGEPDSTDPYPLLLSSDLHQLLCLQKPNINSLHRGGTVLVFPKASIFAEFCGWAKGELVPKGCTLPPKRQHFYLSWKPFCVNKDRVSLIWKCKLVELYQ